MWGYVTVPAPQVRLTEDFAYSSWTYIYVQRGGSTSSYDMKTKLRREKYDHQNAMEHLRISPDPTDVLTPLTSV